MLVDELLAAGAVGAVQGPLPKTSRTWLVLELAVAIATYVLRVKIEALVPFGTPAESVARAARTLPREVVGDPEVFYTLGIEALGDGGLDPDRPMAGDTVEDLFLATIQELIRVEPFSKLVGYPP